MHINTFEFPATPIIILEGFYNVTLANYSGTVSKRNFKSIENEI